MRANARHLIEVAGGSRLWAVVKADGYGHGAIECAGAALKAGAERICCATLEEARELREALGEAVAVVVLSPLEPGEEAAASGLEIVVSSVPTTPGCVPPASPATSTSRPIPGWGAGACQRGTRSPWAASSPPAGERCGSPG